MSGGIVHGDSHRNTLFDAFLQLLYILLVRRAESLGSDHFWQHGFANSVFRFCPNEPIYGSRAWEFEYYEFNLLVFASGPAPNGFTYQDRSRNLTHQQFMLMAVSCLESLKQ